MSNGDTSFTQNVSGTGAQGQQVGKVEGDMNVTQNVGDSAIKLTFQPALDAAQTLDEGTEEAAAIVMEFESKYGFGDLIADGAALPEPTEEDAGIVADLLGKLSQYKGVAKSVVMTARSAWSGSDKWLDLIADTARLGAGALTTIAEITED